MIVNPFSLEGKRVLVTGASSGIGRAAAQMCAQLGATLICLGRDEQRLQQTLGSLAGDGHVVRVADLDDADVLPPMLQDLTAEIGPLSGLVHSAGVLRSTPLRVAKADDFLSQYRTNTVSAALLLKAASRRGVSSPQGCSVVLIGSVVSMLGAAGLAAYCASKAALTGLARTAALELATARIRVNAVLPGMVETKMASDYRATMAADQVQAIEQMHPLGLGQPADVAGAIVFLLSDASRWITGSCLTVDGGYSAH
ncbi:MAG TPA: SDR family NAD(P)-dependent oxidoreductase [Pirellulales bacterium]|jgi:NAD(P)-dependent dehydrogenase (short-subunit alcohol dehydrogenase family)